MCSDKTTILLVEDHEHLASLEHHLCAELVGELLLVETGDLLERLCWVST